MNHSGLYFTANHIEYARRNQQRDPFKSAFERLNTLQESGSAGVLHGAFVWKFFDNLGVGERAIQQLEALTVVDQVPANKGLNAIADAITLAHAHELLRDHPAYNQATQVRWNDAFFERARILNDGDHESFTDHVWLSLLNLVTGITLNDEKIVGLGVESFETIIREEVRPQGFIAKAVDHKDGGSMERQILASAALTLMAEAATHVGINLWDFHERGVSALTAAIYPIYYFYTTEKWQWDDALVVEAVQALFHKHGGYLEIVHKRMQSKDVRTVLTDLRPLWDAKGGGLTTLTHGVVVSKGIFG